jgi:NitT/TauT family transport system permease protein
MSTYSLSDGLASGAPRLSRAPWLASWVRDSGVGILASVAWIAFGLSCLWWEDVGDWSRTHSLGIAAFIVAAIALFGTVGADYLGSAGKALRQRAAWLVALGAFLTLWEVATAKFAWLPLPFFPPPQSII